MVGFEGQITRQPPPAPSVWGRFTRSDQMKLQVNNSGAWKNVLVFSVSDMDVVQASVNTLCICAQEAEYSVSWRIVDARERVTHHRTATEYWKPTRHAADLLA